MNNQILINETEYKNELVKVLGNTYRISQAKGRFNYVAVCKVTNNPFGGVIGKEFENFDKASLHYKSPEMKVALLIVENNFKNS